MLRSNRQSYIACFGTVLVPLVWWSVCEAAPEIKRIADQSPRQECKHPSDTGYSDCKTTEFFHRGISLQDAIDAVSAKREQAKTEGHNEKDLRAQESMAEAAWGLWQLTLIGLFITGIGTVLVAGSLIYAAKGNRIAQDSFVATQRPWIELRGIQPDGPLVFNDAHRPESAFLNVVIHIKNQGKSPAIRISIDLKLVMRNTENLLDQQRRHADAIKKSIMDSMKIPSVIHDEHSLHQDRALKTIRKTAWINTKELREYRAWADNATPEKTAMLGLIGCITYRSPIDKAFHQTAIIREVALKLPGGNTDRWMHLHGFYPKEQVTLLKSDEGTGPID